MAESNKRPFDDQEPGPSGSAVTVLAKTQRAQQTKRVSLIR